MDTDGKRLALAAAAADAEPSRLLNWRLPTHTHRSCERRLVTARALFDGRRERGERRRRALLPRLVTGGQPLSLTNQRGADAAPFSLASLTLRPSASVASASRALAASPSRACSAA